MAANKNRVFSGSVQILLGYVMVSLPLSLLCLLVLGCAHLTAPLGGPTRPLEERVVAGEGKDKVLVIDVSGVISGRGRSRLVGLIQRPSMVTRLKEELEKAKQDEHVKAVVLRINSPGGTVAASDIIYHEIKKFKEEKPVKVVACFMGLGTSGAYYVANAADKIVALPTSVTGSIGVILIKVNVQGLMEKIGVANETVKSGDKKDAVLPLRSMTDEEREILQGVINNLHERFVAIVQESRPEVDLKAHKELTDGRIFTAQEALELKMVDQIGYLDDAIEMAKSLSGIKEARVVMYTRPESYKNNIYSSMEDGSEITGRLHFAMGYRDALGALAGEPSNLLEGFETDFLYLWSP